MWRTMKAIVQDRYGPPDVAGASAFDGVVDDGFHLPGSNPEPPALDLVHFNPHRTSPSAVLEAGAGVEHDQPVGLSDPSGRPKPLGCSPGRTAFRANIDPGGGGQGGRLVV